VQAKENVMKPRNVPTFLIAFILFISFACNMPGPQTSGVDMLLTQAAQTVTASAASTTSTVAVSPTVTITPVVPATATLVPCNQASFISDVTTPDDTVLTVNSPFTKIWRLKNVGSCTWTSGYQLVFDSGDSMGGPASQQMTAGTVAPGQTIDISVNLTAPASAGTYKGNWKMREPGGQTFGLSTGAFWVQIKAAAVGAAEWPTFEQGDEGPEIYAIQLLLNAHGANLVPDGKFGPLTQTAVENFQTDEGLSEDIIVGPQTWEALLIQVQQGKNGPEVRAVQRLLKDKFGYNIAIDGIFGAGTKTAVKDFQTAQGLASDGIVGPKTWQKLISQ
jgi:hypothetical protein